MPSQTTLAIDYAARAFALLIASQYFNSILNTKKGLSAVNQPPPSPVRHFPSDKTLTTQPYSSIAIPLLPPTSLSDEQTLFFPALGGRNGAIGLAILILSFAGDRWAAGVLYACCMVIGFADLWICWRVGSGYGLHVFGTVVLGVMGLGLLRLS